MDDDLYALAAQAGAELKMRRMKLATAESCTGGGIGAAVTMVPGSSDWFECGFITYTNVAKSRMLNVSVETLKRYGAVSEAVVMEMTAGALAASSAGIAVAVSGIAGPGGGSAEKPVGMVCLAWAVKAHEATAETCYFSGDREAVRRQTVVHALNGVISRLQQLPALSPKT